MDYFVNFFEKDYMLVGEWEYFLKLIVKRIIINW